MPHLKLKRGDTVQVMTGKFRGTKGKVTSALPSTAQVVVEGVNLIKRHRKPTNQRDPGGIIDVVKPIDASNVMLVCPSCGKPARIGYKIDDDKKSRFCKKCQATL
jgi:large subunit ribosomal protein L24